MEHRVTTAVSPEEAQRIRDTLAVVGFLFAHSLPDYVRDELAAPDDVTVCNVKRLLELRAARP